MSAAISRPAEAHAMPGRAGGPRPAPVLSTERLVLRPHVLGDWPAFAETLASPRAVHMGGPFAASRSWGMFCADLAGWSLTGAGALSVARADGRVVGQVGLNDVPHFPELELGWMLHEGQEGQGYATEAAAAFLAWIRATIRPASLVSYVAPGNPASAAVAERLGARRDPAASRPGLDDLVFRHEPRP